MRCGAVRRWRWCAVTMAGGATADCHDACREHARVCRNTSVHMGSLGMVSQRCGLHGRQGWSWVSPRRVEQCGAVQCGRAMGWARARLSQRKTS